MQDALQSAGENLSPVYVAQIEERFLHSASRGVRKEANAEKKGVGSLRSEWQAAGGRDKASQLSRQCELGNAN